MNAHNPWAMRSGRALYQGGRRRAHCKIVVDGKDVTNAFDPHLISVQVVDKEGAETDTCAIELDDRDAKLHIPPDDAPVSVSLGWHRENFPVVFEGRVADVESGFGRSNGGRRLWIEAKGVNMKGAGKTPQTQEWNATTPEKKPEGAEVEGPGIPLSTVLQDAGKKAGYKVHVSEKMAGIMRNYWAQQGESFHHFGQRLAMELGGVFKISGENASFTSSTDFVNAAGDPMPEVFTEWGVNLIGWRIKPFVARPQVKEAGANFFDPESASWDQVKQALQSGAPFSRALASSFLPMPAPNKVIGEQRAAGAASAAERKRGIGWVLLNGEPQAKAAGKLTLIGARPGVDGTYKITEAEHTYVRGGGYVTRCDVAQPSLGNYYSGRPEWSTQ